MSRRSPSSRRVPEVILGSPDEVRPIYERILASGVDGVTVNLPANGRPRRVALLGETLAPVVNRSQAGDLRHRGAVAGRRGQSARGASNRRRRLRRQDAGTGFISLTDLRVVLQDESYVGGRVAPSLDPYGGVHAVSLVCEQVLRTAATSGPRQCRSASRAPPTKVGCAAATRRHVHVVLTTRPALTPPSGRPAAPRRRRPRRGRPLGRA